MVKSVVALFQKRFVLLVILVVIFGLAVICVLYQNSNSKSNSEVKVKLYSNQDPVYQNAFTLPNEWNDYGIGDPYILRFDGRYYLYCSTKDGRVGVKAWSTNDLIHWQYEGLVTKDPITTGAYAPEVVYWNGYFYMYTSPAGNGHYVLRSESPTGPFEVKTTNLGLSIDGSVFIDDDGKWYFTHAGDKGIVIHPMLDPYTMDTGKTLNAFLGGWTEGPTIIKRNGTYFLTYTGNHVFSKGYRVNYAVTHGNPMNNYQIPDNNPILIHTTDSFYGLGHSSSFVGPDLDSYYMVYHNLVGASAEGPPVRKMNIDRIVFNGDTMDVLGPTHTPQPVPKQADFHSRLDDAASMKDWEKVNLTIDRPALLCKTKTNASFTAEYNITLPQQPTNKDTYVGAIFAYEGVASYWSARLYPGSHQFTVIHMDQGKEQVIGSLNLPNSLDFTKLHTLRIENDGTSLRVYIDSMQKFNFPLKLTVAGRIGYESNHTEPKYSYTAFSNDVDGSSDFEVYKPLPGNVDAVHFLKGTGRGFEVSEASSKAEFRPEDGVTINRTDDGSYSVRLQKTGDWLSYKVNIANDGPFGIYMTTLADSQGASVEISCGNVHKKFRITGDSDPSWKTVKLGMIDLPKGFHIINIKVDKGVLDFKKFGLYQMTTTSIQSPNVLDSINPDDIYGSFNAVSGGFQGSGTDDDRLFTGNVDWDDYEVSVKVGIPQEFTGEGDILVRATNDSYFPQQVQDSLMGYAINLSDGQIQLQKLNYDSTVLDSGMVTMEPGKTYSLRVRLNGSHIQVYWDGAKSPVIDYVDPNPYFHGRVGIRSDHSTLTFSQMQVNPLN